MKLRFPKGDTHFKESDWDNYQLTQYRQAVKMTRVKGVAVDCGAHAGIMTRRMSEDFQTVHAFEPVHTELLKHNIQDLENVTVYSSALSDAPGTGFIVLNESNSGDNRLSDQGLPVEITTIDSMNFSSVDFIKMDIQGAELPALQGATETILECHPTIMIEVEKNDPWREELEDTLKDWDYTMRYNRNADWIWVWDGWRYC